MFGTTARVNGLTVWDPDGPGGAPPYLVAVGRFVQSYGALSQNVVLWNGVTWSSPGGGLEFPASQTNASIDRCIEFDFGGPGPEGSWLVVGGQFTTPQGSGPLMAWSGSAWHNLSVPVVSQTVSQLATVDPDGPGGPGRARLFCIISGRLYETDLAGTALVNLPAYTGYSQSVSRMASWDPDGPGSLPRQLVVALRRTAVSSGPIHHVLMAWTGQEWGPLLATYDGNISDFVVADLDGAGPEPERLVIAPGLSTTPPAAFFSGEQWVTMGTRNEAASSLQVVDSDGVGGAPARLLCARVNPAGLTEWNGSDWIDRGSMSNILDVEEIDFDGEGGAAPVLVVGGRMTTIPELGGRVVNRIAKQQDAAWVPLSPATDGVVRRLAPWDHDGDSLTPPRLIAAGAFTTFEGTTTGRIAIVDGGVATSAAYSPSPSSSSYSGPIGVFDPDGAGPLPPQVFISAVFNSISGRSMSNIARFDGTEYFAVGNGLTCTSGCGIAMQVFDPDGPGPQAAELVVGGTFTVSGVTNAVNIARWNGTRWAALGAGLNGTVSTLTLWDRDGSGPQSAVLVAGGTYTMTGTTALPGFAVWDGTAWTSLPASGHAPSSMTQWDSDGDGPLPPWLVAAYSESIVRAFNGTVWSNVGTSVAGGFRLGTGFGTVWTVAGIDPDGDGPRPHLLFAVGRFDGYGLWFARNIAMFQYGDWRPVSAEVGSQVFGMVPFDPDGPGPLPVRVMFESTDGNTPRSFDIASLSPWIENQPADATMFQGGEIEFEARPADEAHCSYQWRKDGLPVFDGLQPSGSIATGAAGAVLRLAPAFPADSGRYSCIVLNSCGGLVSREAVLEVRCIGDFDQNGGIDGVDVESFFLAWEAGDAAADVDGSGGVDGQDVEVFFAHWESGAC